MLPAESPACSPGPQAFDQAPPARYSQDSPVHPDYAVVPQSNGAVARSDQPWPVAGAAPSHGQRWEGTRAHLEQPQDALQQDLPLDERLGVNFLLRTNQGRRSDAGIVLGQTAPSLVPHATLPRSLPPTCPLDNLMLDFLADSRARAANGVRLRALVGPPYPSFTSLVCPDRDGDAHPLSKLFTDILRTFPDISGLPEQVAVLLVMFLIMRWMIEPTQENYDRLPEWVTPRPSQLFISHAAWVSYVPW